MTRHVRTPAGVRWYHLPIGSPIGGKYSSKDQALPGLTSLRVKYPSNPKTVSIDGEDVPLDKAVSVVGDAYSWHHMDKEGGNPGDEVSLHQQHEAQVVSKSWYESTSSRDPEEEQYAASLWEQYQSPQLYGKINAALRENKTQDGVTPEAIRRYANVMFQRGGFTTTEPMTVFRAMRTGQSHDWSKELTPGTTFTDKGIVSTTAHERFAQGWLTNDASGAEVDAEKPTDVVMEVKVPTGSRIVGGDPQFIETMLPPNSQFKVLSSTREKAHAVNPLTHSKDRFNYTHVIAELIPQ